MTVSDEPYPFESDDDIEIRELDLESVDALAEARVTISELAGVAESWRYGHVIVDEAQDLTPMQWRMVMRRVRGRSLTIVGDLAQRSASTAQDWSDLLPNELAAAQRQDLTINYRSPVEIHDLAVGVLAEYAPAIAPGRAIRESGWLPEFRRVDDIGHIDAHLEAALESVGGQVAVIDAGSLEPDDINERVRYLTPNQSKGLEFDAVILIEPANIWRDGAGAAELYIALTRATQRLIVLHHQELPTVLTAR
jgi:DNA helicase IV